MSRVSVAKHAVAAIDALAVVGLAPADLTGLPEFGSSAGHAYLVGSLAAGLGNAGSDVDIHILRDDLSTKVGPYLHFVHGTVVDVEGYPLAWTTQVLNLAATAVTADTPLGRLAADPVPAPSAGWRTVARWLQAAPLTHAAPAVFDVEQRAAVLPFLIRIAYDAVLGAIALARLADTALAAESAREYLWRQASLRLLDLLCRAAGDVAVNDKWIASRGGRLGLAQWAESRCEPEFRRDAEQFGLPPIDEWAVTRLDTAAGASQIRFAGRPALLNRHGRLLRDWCPAAGTLDELVGEVGAARLLRAIQRAELDLSVDAAASRKALLP